MCGPEPEVVSENMAHLIEPEPTGHVVDGVGICTRCGACLCCQGGKGLTVKCKGALHR